MLEDLTLNEWRNFSRVFDERIKKAISVDASVNSRRVKGGTALGMVKKRLKEIKKEMK